MTPVPDTSGIPTTWAPLLISAIMALAIALVYLWRYYANQMKEIEVERRSQALEQAKEREAWAVERVEIRAEYEAKYHATLRQLYEDAREYEIAARREFAENMEIVASKAAEASERVAAVLDKIYDRFIIGPRRSPH
jgi:biopolymer transport protein ExbB/TolQ